MNKITPKLTPDLQSAAKFQPKQETLPPLAQLLQQARIETRDVTNALQTWVVDCPDGEYINLLEAE